MTTAQQLIESALRKIQVKGAETPLSTAELDDGLETLNNMAAELEAEGFELYTGGYVALALGDTVPIPAYAENFYKLQLGGRLAPEYLNGTVPTFLTDLLQGARRIVIRELNRKAVGVSGTYQNIIYGAFELSGVKSGDDPISSTELQNAIPRLNDLITSFESKGFILNYQITDGSDLTAEHGLPDWSWSWIKASLALRLSSSYSIPPNEVAMAMASDGEACAYERTGGIPTMDYPSTLPTGSGRGYYREFYTDTAKNDLQTAAGGYLLDDEGLPLEDSL